MCLAYLDEYGSYALAKMKALQFNGELLGRHYFWVSLI